MRSCLVVIDAQESFRHRPYFTDRDLPAYLAAQNALIEGCVAAGVPVVRVFQVIGPEITASVFAPESGLVRPLEGLVPVDPAATFYKSGHSALEGTGLQAWLAQNGVERLIVSGIRTELCCGTTARHASELGFAVDYVMDATLTFDKQLQDGPLLPAATIKALTADVLRGRFATISTVEQALQRSQSECRAT
jgi:nicotinamidase-related amidase